MRGRRRLRGSPYGPVNRSGFAVPQGGKARAVMYARNAISAVSRKSPSGMAIADWCEEVNGALQLEMQFGEESWNDFINPQVPSTDIWQKLNQTIDAAVERAGPCSAVTPFVDHVGFELGLDLVESQILQFCIDYCTVRATERLFDKLSEVDGECASLRLDARFLSLMLGHDEAVIADRIGASAPLRESGLLRFDQKSGVAVLPRLLFHARQATDKCLDARSALLGEQQVATLTLHDFEHLGRDVEQILGILRGALKARAKGVAVLIHGDVGTGKTELAKTLAAALAMPLYAVGEMNEEDGSEPTRWDRLADLQVAQKLLAAAEPALLLVDESEDIFGDAGGLMALFGGRRNVSSRAYVHRMLENAPVPVILTANDIRAFGPAVLRRMTAVVEVRVPPSNVRARIWTHAAAAEGVEVDQQDIKRLAKHLPAAPAIARNSMRAAALGGGSKATIQWSMEGVLKAVHGRAIPVVTEATEFDLALVNVDQDIAALAERLSQPIAPRNVSCLFSGASGTGKSYAARYLAERMGMEVLVKRGSDILGKYVGETEKRIAAAFSEAMDCNGVLIIDEAEALISDRRGADRNWEVSKTNEFLTHMEAHSLPFFATTNLMERVDTAFMRRFLIKAKFGPLRIDQAKAAFQRFFQMDPPPGMSDFTGLTPADFALVQRKAQLHGLLNDSAFLLASLGQEQAAKGVKKQPIGFLH